MRHRLLPFGEHLASINAEIAKLAFAIGTVEVNMKQNFTLFEHVAAKASPAFPLADLSWMALLHLLQQVKRYLHELIIDKVLPLPDCSQHQDSLVAGEMRQRMLDERDGIPLTSLRRAEFRDADLVPSGDVAGFRLERQPRLANGDVGLWAVRMRQDDLLPRPPAEEKGTFHERFKINSLRRDVRIDRVMRDNPTAQAIDERLIEKRIVRHPCLSIDYRGILPKGILPKLAELINPCFWT